MHGNPAEVVSHDLAFTGVHAHSDPDAEVTH
jgi:hypothetical protein